MKKLKNLTAVLLTMVLAVLMAVPAFAADTYTITGPGNGRTYYVYQIFTGTVGEDGALTDIAWGQNSTGTAGEGVSGDVLNALSAVADSTSDTEKLAVITRYWNENSETYATFMGGFSTQVPAGYYLIRDRDDADPDHYIVLEIVGDVTINPRTRISPPL